MMLTADFSDVLFFFFITYGSYRRVFVNVIIYIFPH